MYHFNIYLHCSTVGVSNEWSVLSVCSDWLMPLQKNHSVVCTWWNTLKYARQSVVQFVICVCFIQVNNVKTVFWDWSYYTPMFSLLGFILCLYWFFCRKLYWDLPRQLLTPQPLLSWKPRPLPVLRTTLPARTESSLRPPSVPWPRRSSWPALKWAMLSH